ncbi:hypothetical protein [Massilia sp.]|uniref:hypothetical protein n=1 Tax=Massilia sp. TaxID=1882437 RepID=UPI00289BB92A|nr:hypothetical protein [Massilia sp.]
MTETATATPPKPHAVATTTPAADTFVEAKLTEGGGILIYWPEKNAFLACYEDEHRALMAEADEHNAKIAALQEANRAVTAASLKLREAQKSNVKPDIDAAEAALKKAISEMAAASDAVKKKLEPLQSLDAKEGVKMVEMVALKTRKYGQKPTPIYVKSTSLKRVLADNRIYLVEGEKAKRKEDKILKDGKLNVKEIKHRITEKVQDKTKFSKEWKLKPEDADAYTGVLFAWARTMNGDIATFIERNKGELEKYLELDPDNPERRADLSADAQLMRYSAGAGLEINFNPFTGNLHDGRDRTWTKRALRGLKSGEFGIKGNAHASFAVAEGKVRTEVYYPHFAGWHVQPTIAGQTFEMGYMRLYGDLVLSGGVGASLAVETDIGISYTGGKQGIRGVPPANRNKRGVRARAGADAGLDAFIGGRVSIDIHGEVQWLNPEGDASDGKPATVKPGDAIGEYKTVAKVGAGVTGSAGAGIKGAFKIGINKGKFVISARVGACLGLGGEAALTGEVGYDTIQEFFKFVSYQLKRADYHRIGDFMEEQVYEYYCKVSYLVVAKGAKLVDYADKIGQAIEDEYDDFKNRLDNAIENGAAGAEQFMNNIRSELLKKTGSWFSYSPPEVTGQINRQIALIGISAHPTLGQEASRLMALSLGSPQTMNQLATIAERMTPTLGDKQNQAMGFAMIDNCLQGTRYASARIQAEERLAGAQTLVSKPYIWNTEPEFVTARMGIDDAMYS